MTLTEGETMRFPNPNIWFVKAALVVGLSAAAPSMVHGAPNCTCRYGGQSFALGTCVCIVTPNGARVACCDMVLNNTSWTFTGNGCPIAIVPDPMPTQSIAKRLRSAVQERWWQGGRRHFASMTE